MPSYQPFQSIGAEHADTPVFARRLYAAIVIGLAIFLLGLLLWPSPRSSRKSLTVIQIETRSASLASRRQVEGRLNEIRTECANPARIREVVKSLASQHPEVGAEEVQDLSERISIRLLPNSGAITATKKWRIEIAVTGTGQPHESKLIAQIAADLMDRFQDDAPIDRSGQILDEVRDVLSKDTNRLRALSDRLSTVADQQWNEIESILNEQQSTFGSPTNLRSEDSNLLADGVDQEVDLNDYAPIRRNDSRAERVENPNWLALTNEKDRLEALYDKLTRQNLWPPSHSELKRIDDDLQLMYRQLAITPRYLSTDRSTQPLNREGGARNRVPAQFVDNSNINNSPTLESTNTNAISGMDAQMSRVLREALSVPVNDLRGEVVDLERSWRRSLDDINAQQLDVSTPTLDRMFVADPPQTQSRTIPRGLFWRLSLILLASSGASGWVLVASRNKSEAKLDSSLAIEQALGLPVVGQLGKAKKQSVLRAKVKSLLTWVRVAESTVMVISGLVMLVAIGDPNGLTDLAQNPLLTVCDILGSISRF